MLCFLPVFLLGLVLIRLNKVQSSEICSEKASPLPPTKCPSSSIGVLRCSKDAFKT